MQTVQAMKRRARNLGNAEQSPSICGLHHKFALAGHLAVEI